MTNHRRRWSHFVVLVSAWTAIQCSMPPAAASTYYWDINGTTAGSGNPATGAWNGTAFVWTTDPTGGAGGMIVNTTSSSDDLRFLAGADGTSAYTVTITGVQAANSLTFLSIGATTGAPTISGGTLSLSGGGITVNSGGPAVTISSAVTIAAPQTWTNNSANTLVVSGTAAINNALTLNGTGVVNLSGNLNTGTGGVNIYNGTLLLTVFPPGGGGGTYTLGDGATGNNATISNSGLTVINSIVVAAGGSGTYKITNNSNTSATFNTGTLTLNNNLTLDGGTSNGLTFNDAITGGSTLNVTGTAASFVSLGGSNTGFTGSINVQSGTLRVQNVNAVGTSAGAITVSSGATLDILGTDASASTKPIILSGNGVNGAGALINSNNFGSKYGGDITLASNVSMGGDGSGNLVLSGSISDSGNAFSVTKVGTRTLTLSGASRAYTGATNVTSGSLILDFANSTGDVSNSALTFSGNGSLTVNGKNGFTRTQTFTGTTINTGYSSVTVNNSGGTMNVALGGLTRAAGQYGVLDFTGTMSTTASNDATGIIGTWATIGIGGGQFQTDYATVNGSNQIVALAASATAESAWTSTTGNYNFNAAATLTDHRSVNTLRYSGGANTLDLAGFNLTTNGLLNGGSSTLTVNASGGKILGAGSELDIGGKSAIAVNAPIDLASGKTMVYAGTNTFTVSGGISTSGPTTMVFNGSGATTINTTPLTINGNTNILLNGTGNFTIASSAVLTLGANVTVGGAGTGSLTSSDLRVDVNGGDRTLTLNKATTFPTLLVKDTSGSGDHMHKLTIGGSGNVTFTAFSPASGGQIGDLEINGTGSYTFSNSTAANFTGNITLSAGTLSINNLNGLGSGAIILAGGTIHGNNANGNFPNTNPLQIAPTTSGGAVTIGLNWLNRNMTFSGATQSISNFPVISYTDPGTSTLTFNTAVMQLNSGATFQTSVPTGSSNGSIALSGGLDLVGGNRTLTLNGPGTITISGLLRDSMGGAQKLVLAGSGLNNIVGAVTPGTNNPGIEVNSTTGGLFTFNGASTYTGGTVLTSGGLGIGVSSTLVSSVLTSGPVGTGPLTVAGGNLRLSGSSGLTVNNDLNITGDATLGNIGNLPFSATLTLNPAARSPAGTITFTGNRTITTMSAVTLTGPITGSGTTVTTLKGPGTLALSNTTATANTLGNVILGDNLPSGALGASVTAASQNALGAGTYTLNYGAILKTDTTTFSVDNNITVNNGGKLNLIGSSTPTKFITYNSGAIISNNTGTLNLKISGAGANASFPTAGALLFDLGSSVGMNSTAMPSLTGTFAFANNMGGSQVNSFAQFVNPSSVDGSPRTIAFDGTNGGVVFTNGVELNANLTIAGGGNNGLLGFYPTKSSTLDHSLGKVTTKASQTRDLIIAMSPTGSVWATNTTSITGNLVLNSGIFSVLSFSTSPATSITLNGGTFRGYQTTSNATNTLPTNITVGSNGGTLAHLDNSGTTLLGSFTDFTGTITGSTPITLLYGGLTNLRGGVSVQPANNSSFSGGFVAATMNGAGRIRLNAKAINGLTGAGSSKVVVGDGLAFEPDTMSTLTSNTGKYQFSSNAILGLNSTTSAQDIDLAGMNLDVRIGTTTGDLTYSGTITPYNNVYKFAPSGANATATSTLTIAASNKLTDAGGPARSLDVAAPAVAVGSVNIVPAVFAITAGQDYSGDTKVTGTVRNSLMGGGVTGTTLTLSNNGATSSGNLSVTASITVDLGSTLQLTGLSGAQYGRITKSSVPITIKGNSTLTVGDSTTNNTGVTNRIAATAALTLGGMTGGGKLTIQAGGTSGANAYNQTFASLAIGPGTNTIQSAGANANNVANLTFSTLPTRTQAGGILNYTSTTGFTTTFTGASATNLLGGWAFVGTSFAALNSSGQVIAATPNTTDFDTDNGDYVNTVSTTRTLTANRTVRSLTLNTTGNSPDVKTNRLTVGSGGIYQPGAISLTLNSTTGGGTLTSGYSPAPGVQELIFNVSQFLSVVPQIVKNTADQNVDVTLTMAGGGIIALTNNANQIAGLNLAGTVELGGTSVQNVGAGGTWNFFGGKVRVDTTVGGGTAAFSNAYSMVVGPQGGAFDTNGAMTVNFAGNISLSGELKVGDSGTSGAVFWDLGGAISGAGTILARGQTTNQRNVLTLSGNNSTWTGGIRNDGTSGPSAVRLNNQNALGTGTFVGASNTSLYFTSVMAGASLTNDIVGPAVLVNWATASPVVLSGKYYTSQGLTAQGFASGGAASELVLAGTTAISGTPLTYNWSDTPASVIQNFVNGQGSITLGSTGNVGITTLSSNVGSVFLAQYIDTPTSTQSTPSNLTQGALGFIRFSGVNSFIPGAVGPGYLAALHKGGDTTNYGGTDTTANGKFGYLLTGSSLGTTYTLPEGKSFVIGSLGAGTQFGGTLGVSGNLGTAILIGGNKAAAGQLLAGFTGGDVNIHANGQMDVQTLNLSAANGDTFVLGSATNNVVFTPTYGDSGYTSAMTLMAMRTGGTTLNKVGDGVVEVRNAAFTNTDGSDARTGFAWNVLQGTLNYTHDDAAAARFNTATVASAATLVIGAAGRMNVENVVNNGSFNVASTNQAVGAISGTGTTSLASNAQLSANRIVQTGAGGLTINGSSGNPNAKVAINASSGGAVGSTSGTSHLGSLSVSNNFASLGTGPYAGPARTYYGTLDLANNDLVIDNAALLDVADMIRGGMTSTSSPTWTGTGIGSSFIPTASAPFAGAIGLGTMRNDADPTTAAADSPAATFSGVSGLVGNEVLVKLTYFGDFNLDGKVDAFDFALADAGYAHALQSDGQAGWFFGDANYDGRVDSLDFALVDAGYNAYHGSSLTQLPEPGSFVLAVLGLAGLLSLRRSRRQLYSSRSA